MAVIHVIKELNVSERRACRAIGHHRSTQKYECQENDFSKKITDRVIVLASQYGRYGYRTITDLLNNEGYKVNKKRVERIWRLEGLKVPKKQPKRSRLWLNDGSCIRMRPEFKNHVWSYDFVFERTHDGRSFKMLNIIDEFTREVLMIKVKRKLNSIDVLEALAELFLTRGVPKYIRSDNGPEFIAVALRSWLERLNISTLFIEPGSPWENGYIESFNGKMRDQFLNGEIFYTLKEAQVLIEWWRKHYNQVRPHSSLKGKPPAPLTFTVVDKHVA